MTPPDRGRAPLWFVQAPGEDGDFWVDVDDDSLDALTGKTSNKSRWKVERTIATGKVVPDMAIEFRVVNHGRRVGDLLWTGGGPLYVVSERFVEVLRSIGASGWRPYEAVIWEDNGEEVEGFCGLAVTGTCGDHTATLPKEVVTSSLGFPVRRGVDASVGWDGSDVFGLRDRPSVSFGITDRVREALVDAGAWVGVEFTREDEYEEPVY